MSIFAKIRGAKKAAEEHKNATANNNTAEVSEKPAAYKHVPTHAAVDALSGAPSTWKAEDRTLIKAQHKRRSAMIRNNSGLSTVNTLPRTGSYTGSTWTVRGGEGRLKPYNGDSGLGRSPMTSHEITPIISSSHSTASTESSHIEIQKRPTSNQYSEPNVFSNLHKSTTRKVGEAPLYDAPPPRPKVEATSTTAPVPATQKKRWRFSRQSQAVAAA